jgi:hypothetical protein
MDEIQAPNAAKRKINWWKVAFFVTLLVFEGAREIAVINIGAPPNIAIGTAFSQRSPDGSLVSADGRWARTDGGEPLIPAAVSIECWRERGTCVMATTEAYDGYIHLPEIDQRDATFTGTGAEFTDDWPVCNKLFVRIDGVHNLTTAVRSRKETKDPQCKGSEPEIQLRLSGFDPEEHKRWTDKHFVPLLSVMGAVLRMFD